MAQAVTHPLLSLPDDQIIQKLREMSLEEILKFSLISERCKGLVESIQIKGTSLDVFIGSSIDVSVRIGSKLMSLDFYNEQDMYWEMGAYGRKKKLTPPQSAHIRVFGENYFGNDWVINDLTIQYWLKHLQDIFNYHKIDYIWFSDGSSQFDIDDIKEVFRNTKEVKIYRTGCYIFSQMIIQNCFPLEKLTIRANNFPDSNVPEKILMQNFAILDIGIQMEERKMMTFDELLLINSRVVRVENLQISPKQVNQFIKLWQKGSNHHIEYLWIEYSNVEENDIEIIMKGIKHDVIPDNQSRKFQTVGFTEPSSVCGGMEIYRKDGVKATIQIKYGPMFSTIQMYVWFDHCVVES